jgi:hypothetical protein
MKSQRARAAATVLLGLLSGTMLAGAAYAKSNSRPATAASAPASPWDQLPNGSFHYQQRRPHLSHGPSFRGSGERPGYGYQLTATA